MKQLLTLLMLTFSTLSFSQIIFLESTDIQDLNLDQSEIEIGVSYPGAQLSGICGVEMRSESYIEDFAKLIKIETAWGIDPVVRRVHDSILLVDLTEASGRYLTSFIISTKNGKTLKENINSMSVNRGKIILVTRTCP
jgi:hypothetical protein